MKRKQIPPEAIISLRQRLEQLPPRSPARRILMKETATAYGVSVDTLYRALRERGKPKSIHRSDRGKLRKLTNAEMEYYCEVIAAALRFLFNAMSAKKIEGFNFQGIPQMLYLDNGPIAKSRVFLQVMEYLGVKVMTHLPQSQDKRRTTARAKGKVERAFRTVKEAHETLYHFHEPETEAEANAWLHQYLIHYNNQPHRLQSHSRFEDWCLNLPKDGIRQMCNWERFCTFAREPEQRKVGIDARVTVEGVAYEVDPNLAGEKVTLWWGLFDNELYIEHQGQRYGPYTPVGGPIPLHRYRSFKKTKNSKRAERIEKMAQQLGLPPSAIAKNTERYFLASNPTNETVLIPFTDPDPFQEFTYPSILSAKRAIADYLNQPLAKLNPEQMAFINQILSETLNKKAILEQVKSYFHGKGGEEC